MVVLGIIGCGGQKTHEMKISVVWGNCLRGRGSDSTIAPPQKIKRISLKNVSWLLETRKDAMKEQSSRVSLFAKEALSNYDVGVARGTVFRETQPGAGF